MSKFPIALCVALSFNVQAATIQLGSEAYAQASICPDQATAQAVLTAHVEVGLEAARLIYTDKCISAPVFITPQRVVYRAVIEGETVRVIESLIRMKDNSQTVWYLITTTPIYGET